MTTTTDEESSTAAALPQIQHEGIMKEDDGAQKPKDDESNIMEDNGGAVTVPLTRRVGWADGAPHVKDSTDPTEEDLQQPLSEKFEEEGSRSAAVSDEAALIHQQTTATIQIAADAAVHQHNTIGRIDKTSSLLDLPPSKATANNNIETKTTSVEDIREAIEATSLIISENMTGTVEVAVDAAADEGIHQKEEETIRQKEEETMQPKTLFEVSPAPSPSGGVIMSPSMNEETIRERTMAYEASASPEAASQLLSLPIDSLHCIASFLAPEEWANYGQTCQSANKVCREIFRRVRMHGFRCATEVITAWKLGQHADAKELAALYISAGVPIYPYSLGHSYHTICWRLGVEVKDMEEKAEAENANSTEQEEDNTAAASPVDRFYTDRLTAFRGHEAPNPVTSYLEEKCMFLAGPTQLPSSPLSGRWSSFTNLSTPRRQQPLVPPVAAIGGNQTAAQHSPAARMLPSSPLSSASSPGRSFSQTDMHSLSSASSSKVPKVTVSIHRHLLDQHLLGRSSVDDEEGAMKTPPVNLAADFFHPHLCAHTVSAHTRPLVQPFPASPSNSGGRPGAEALLEDPAFQAWAARAASTVHNRLGGQAAEDAEELVELQELYSQIFAADRMTGAANLTADSLVENEVASLSPPPPVSPQPPSSPPNSWAGSPDDSFLSGGLPRFEGHSVLNSVDLEVYSASSANLNGVEGVREVRRHLKTRFTFYQRRLEVLLLHGDSEGYEECMLDLWDEFLPLTANIHYYDRHTAVPRFSNLQKFLMQPCPKAVGTIQCEIKRIVVGAKKKKGVGMKNRFFPTYEYRLFIRDREHGKQDTNEADNASETDEDNGIRRDTILMVAKNRGRKHVDSSGVVSMTPTSKKGANNYHLYLPEQEDVDTHFNGVNEGLGDTTGNVNGVSLSRAPSTENRPPVMLGRLQSNFIGTEFQIYTPRLRKGIPGKPIRRSASMGDCPASFSEDFDGDAGAISDTGTHTRRKSRFGRLTLRRSSSSAAPPSSSDLAGPASSENFFRSKSRSRQEGSVVRTPRMNRRAIANSAETAPDEDRGDTVQQQPILCEEEDGVITYTANLLGSRPRIMDVCIPKLPTEGSSGSVWRQYVENCEENDDCPPYNRMLNCFKQLQQRLENQHADNSGVQNEGEDRPDDFGLRALQNRPPWWNVELGSFVLNFRGRVSVASVKNFQLCDRNDHDSIMLQFGRIDGRHSFTMDYQYPLTAVQAFSIAISSLQSKISFG